MGSLSTFSINQPFLIKILRLYIQIPKIYSGVGVEFWPERILNLVIVCPYSVVFMCCLLQTDDIHINFTTNFVKFNDLTLITQLKKGNGKYKKAIEMASIAAENTYETKIVLPGT